MKPAWLAVLLALTLSSTGMAAEEKLSGPPRTLQDMPQHKDFSPTTVMTSSESRSFLENGAPKCRKGTQRVSFAQGQFLHDGKSLTADGLIAAIKRQPLGKRPSCLRVESAEYDREIFMQLSSAVVEPLSVSLFWKKPSP